MGEILNIFILAILPLLAGILIFVGFFRNNTIVIRRFAKYFNIAYLVYALGFLINYNTNSELQYVVNLKNYNILFGFDALGMILSTLVIFIVTICMIVAKSTLINKQKLFYSFALFFEASAVLLFCVQNLYLFCLALFFEIFCAYILISNFALPKGKITADRYAILNFSCSLAFMGAMTLISAVLIKNSIYPNIQNLVQVSSELSSLVQFLAFFAIALLVFAKLPIFPFHKILQGTIEGLCAPLCFVFLTEFILGFFIFIKFNMYALNYVFGLIAPYLAIVAMVNVIYFAFLAIGSKDIKKSFAYFCFSQVLLTIPSLASININGVCGAIYQIISQSLILLGLFLCYCFVVQIFKTTKLPFMGGLASYAPKLAALTFVFTLAGANLPLTCGFVSRFLCILGGFSTEVYTQNTIWMCTLFIIPVFILGMIYVIKTFQNIFFGAGECSASKASDLLRHRWIALLIVGSLIIILGVFPYYLGEILSRYADMIVSMFSF